MVLHSSVGMCPVACEHPSGTFGRVACVLTLKSALFAAERLALSAALAALNAAAVDHERTWSYSLARSAHPHSLFGCMDSYFAASLPP